MQCDVGFGSDLPVPFWLEGFHGRCDGASSARACLPPTHAAIPPPGAPQSCRNTNPRTDRETVAWRAPLTVLEALGAVRVVAVGVSGAAGLCIKR
jgi:hypothetical protein